MSKFKNFKRLRSVLIFVLLGIALLVGQYAKHFSEVTILPGYYRVTQFFDGDTIEIDMNGVREKVRFIGVDTPETHKPNTPEQCYGKNASEFTKVKLRTKQVRLEADPKSSNRDKYNRLLRYVYTSDGELLNLKIIELGNGFAIRGFEHSKKALFIDSEALARSSGVGLWKVCGVEFGNYYETNNL